MKVNESNIKQYWADQNGKRSIGVFDLVNWYFGRSHRDVLLDNPLQTVNRAGKRRISPFDYAPILVGALSLFATVDIADNIGIIKALWRSIPFLGRTLI